jgi:hypothetical protein
MRLKSLLPMLTVAAIAAMPHLAQAQTAPRVTFTTPTTAATTPAPSLATQAAEGSYWELIGGVEFAADGLFYGFFGPQWNRPLNDNVKLTARAYANWLKYEFDEAGGTTEVSGPGISTRVGLKFGDRNTFGVGAGPSFKWRNETFIDASGNEIEIDDSDGDGEIDDDMEIGFNVGADANLNPTSRDNIHAIVNYETVDEYLWSRLAYKRQITNLDWSAPWATSLGAEGILQGNEDITTWMFGGLVEFAHGPSRTSLMLRGGYKKSSFDTADDRTGAYVGVNLYKRIGS